MNTTITVNRLLAIAALVIAILSLIVDGPLLVVAVIILALAVLL